MEEMKDKLIENLESVDKAVLTLKDAYELLIKIYKRYIVLDEKLYPVIACWILGCYFHKHFLSFPYLFLNAPKQSGKSRFLKLSAVLVRGVYTVNLTEAVLFRENVPLFVDEIEQIKRKEKSGLRELLNVAYKKGGVVKRVEKNEKTGEVKVKEFELYRPVAMANIEGMDDVLEDRCIVINLERCFDSEVTRRLEFFDFDEDIRTFLSSVSYSSVVDVDVDVKGIYRENVEEIIKSLFLLFNKSTHIDLTTSLLETTLNNIALLIYNKIKETTLQSRDLELFLPLFIVSAQIEEGILDQLIEFAIEYANKRKEENVVENRDTIFIGFLASYCKANNFSPLDFIPISQIVRRFLEINPDEDWFNSKWVGHALKRLGKIVLEKRRLGRGREVRLNIEKLEEKAEKFGFNVKDYADEIKSKLEAKETQTTLWEED